MENESAEKQPNSRRIAERGPCIYTLSLSAQLLGICLTVIGLIRVAISTRPIDTVADDLLVFDALVFLICCTLSYWAIRSANGQPIVKIERIIDLLFLGGLLIMVVVGAIITYSVV